MWWLRLGIGIERIKPGNPQQNGRHERMHLTLKKEATKPAAKNFLQQQAKFDQLHRVLQPRAAAPGARHEVPGRALHPSPRPYHGLAELEYPFHDRTITVTSCGRICLGQSQDQLERRLRRPERRHQGGREKIWLVSFMHYDLGFFDQESGRVACAENPFEAKVLPMSPV